MKRTALLLALALTLISARPAHADEASKRGKVLELFALLHMDQTMDQTMKMIMGQALSNAQQLTGGKQQLPPETQAKLEAFQTRLTDLVTNAMSWKSLEPDFTKIYMDNYTEDELDAIVTFYKSPAGISMVAKTPVLMQQSMAVSQSRVQQMLPQLQQLLADFTKDVAKSAPQPK
jgi:hypothetical protein